MGKFFYLQHPLRCVFTGPSECGKSVFLSNLILSNINEYDKFYVYSPSFPQHLYQSIIKCFSIFIPIHIFRNLLNEEDTAVLSYEVFNNKDFEKSDTEMEAFESIGELNFPQEYEDSSNIILDDLNEKELNGPRAQAKKQCSNNPDIILYLFS